MWPSGTTWWHWWRSTLPRVRACCLTESHCPGQCWVIISKVLWYLSEAIIIRRSDDTNQSGNDWKLHFLISKPLPDLPGDNEFILFLASSHITFNDLFCIDNVTHALIVSSNNMFYRTIWLIRLCFRTVLTTARIRISGDGSTKAKPCA